MDGLEILNDLNQNKKIGISLNFENAFKLPVVIITFGNILYAFLAVLKVRILTDTYESTDKAKIMKLIYLYLAIVIIGSLLSLLFIALG